METAAGNRPAEPRHAAARAGSRPPLVAQLGSSHAFRAGVHRPSTARAVALRGRMIRVFLMLPTHCRKELGGGRHQIDAILSPVPGAGSSSQKDLTDSRKGAILVS